MDNKKFWVVGLVMVFALIAAACGSTVPEVRVVEKEVEVTRVVTVAEPAPELEPGTYYWLAANNSNSFYNPGLVGWNQAAKELNVNVEFVGPEEPNLAEQIATLETLVASEETRGVFFYAMDFNAGEPTIIEAEAKGLPIIYGNTDSPFKTRRGFIGTESSIMGQQAAGYVKSKLGCDITVAGMGNNGIVCPGRLQYFLDAFAELCPESTALELGLNDGSLQGSITALQSYVIAHPEVDLIWWGDGAAGQLVEVWKEIKDSGFEGQFLGTDMQKPALEAVRDGDWLGTIGQDTYAEEYWGLYFLVAASKGVAIPDTTMLSTMIITQENVAQYLD